MAGIRTLLIGIDGATFTVLDPLMEQGVMPFLRSFYAEGVRAGLRTIVPALTPPAWTSLMTGRTPGHHGVFDFFRKEAPDSHNIRFFTSRDVAVDTVWSLAGQAGLRVTSLNYPAMFPAPRLEGNIVPGWVPWKQLRLACWPSDLFDRLKNIPGFNAKELGMDIKLEEKATEGCADAAEYGPWIEFHIRRENNWFQICKSLNEADPSPLTAVLFDGVDKLQHLCWRFIRPEDDRPLREPWEHEARRLCLEYFRNLDQLLRQLCEMAGPEATVLLASDHGFGPTRDVFHVNSWLSKHGYLKWSEGAHAGYDTQGAQLGVGQVARHTFLMDWTATRAFATTPTSNGIYFVIDRDGKSPGLRPEEVDSFADRLREDLLAFRDPETGTQPVTEVWKRSEIFPGQFGEYGPDLTLVMHDGGLISILPGEQLLTKRASLGGAHRPLGIFGAKGPGIRRGFDAGELHILDIAPTVLHSLGLPVEATMQGRVPEEIFTSPVSVQRRSAHAAPAQDGAAAAEEAGMTAEDEQIVMERLRELGYIE